MSDRPFPLVKLRLEDFPDAADDKNRNSPDGDFGHQFMCAYCGRLFLCTRTKRVVCNKKCGGHLRWKDRAA